MFFWSNKESDLELIKPYIDAPFYSKQTSINFPNTEAATNHYLHTGWKFRLDPSAAFSTKHYLEKNPDVDQAGINPLVHFLVSGWKENRTAFSDKGLLIELIAYNDGDIKGMGLRPIRIMAIRESLNKISGWCSSTPSEPGYVEIYAQDEKIGLEYFSIGAASQNESPVKKYQFDFFIPANDIHRKTEELEIRISIGGKVFHSHVIDHLAAYEAALYSLEELIRHGSGMPDISACSIDIVKTLLKNKHQSKGLIKHEEQLVSVIMPAFNRAAIIGDAIKSVARQTYINWELLIIDDGSTDNTLTAARLAAREMGILSKVRFITLDKNQGVSYARNRGLENSSGQIIAYLDTDNSWDRNYLSFVTSELLNSPDYFSVYSGQSIHYYNKALKKDYMVGIRLKTFDRVVLERSNFIDLNCFAHRRALYEEFGGFDEGLRRLVDWELILRYTKKSVPKMIPLLLGRYNLGFSENQISRLEDLEAHQVKIAEAIKQ